MTVSSEPYLSDIISISVMASEKNVKQKVLKKPTRAEMSTQTSGLGAQAVARRPKTTKYQVFASP